VSTGGSPSTSIVGSGTAFTTELRVGQGIQGEPGSGSGASYVVSIEDDEHLTADGNLTFTAGSTLYVGSHGEINGVRGDISVSSTGGLWQDNNFYLTGALSVGSTARNSWLRLNGLHPCRRRDKTTAFPPVVWLKKDQPSARMQYTLYRSF
jgi:hypothetical protein